MKKTYCRPDAAIVCFTSEDILTLSNLAEANLNGDVDGKSITDLFVF